LCGGKKIKGRLSEHPLENQAGGIKWWEDLERKESKGEVDGHMKVIGPSLSKKKGENVLGTSAGGEKLRIMYNKRI